MVGIRKNIWLLAFIAKLLLIGCSSNKSKEGINETLEMDNWKCHALSSDEICLPKKWNPIEQNSAYYFAYLDNENSQTYFAIVRHSILEDSLNAKLYLKNIYDQLISEKDKELFEGYTLSELKFNDYLSYYGEYYTQIGNKSYFTYSMVREYKKDIYEIILKVPRDNSLNYKDIFQKILAHFRVDGKTIFNMEDEILDKKFIKIHE